MKDAADADDLDRGRRFAAVAAAHGALFILNDRPDLVEATGADGVHVGQDDAAVHEARAIVGPDRLVGLSTHSPQQIDAAAEAPSTTSASAPSTRPRPSRAGRRWDSSSCATPPGTRTVPFFAIGGIDTTNVDRGRATRAQPGSPSSAR